MDFDLILSPEYHIHHYQYKNIFMNKNHHFVKMPIMTSSGTVLGFEVLLRKFNGIPLSTFNLYPELFTEFTYEFLHSIFILDTSQIIRDDNEFLFINLTIDQLLSNGTLSFLTECNESNVKMVNVIIEITENEMFNIHDKEKISERILLFRTFGYQFAIDDFGVEHSNFQRVFDIKPEFIKLDREMIINYSEQEKPSQAFEQLIGFCHKIDTKVIAEGIESEKIYTKLIAAGVDYFQGYYFGLPKVIPIPPSKMSI